MSRLLRLGLLLLCLAPLTGCYNDNPVYPDGSVGDYQLAGDLLSCLPNGDGKVDKNEINFVAGLSANYLVNPPGTLAEFDAKGQLLDGQLEWDFSQMQGVVTKLDVNSPRGFWFADKFPSADLAIPTSARGEILQLLDVQDDKVLLLGLASREPDKTLTIYEPPIVALKFPLEAGLTYSSSATLKEGSKVDGLPVYTEDTYSTTIRAEGNLRLPHLRLHRTLRVETEVTIRTLGGVVTKTRQLQWFSECYGEVVRALSQTDESDPLFVKATELRRLSL